MIKFTLACDEGHEFEAWFSSSDAYDKQRDEGLVGCAICGSTQVDKALMTPSIAAPDRAQKELARQAIMQSWREWSKKASANAEHVGVQFAEEARKIHYGEVEERAIVGEASLGDIRELTEEGIGILPLAPDPSKTGH